MVVVVLLSLLNMGYRIGAVSVVCVGGMSLMGVGTDDGTVLGAGKSRLSWGYCGRDLQFPSVASVESWMSMLYLRMALASVSMEYL